MKFIVAIAVFAVMLVLMAGLIVLMKGGDPKLSNKMMRLRVGAQAIAIVVIMVAVWLGGQAGN